MLNKGINQSTPSPFTCMLTKRTFTFKNGGSERNFDGPCRGASNKGNNSHKQSNLVHFEFWMNAVRGGWILYWRVWKKRLKKMLKRKGKSNGRSLLFRTLRMVWISLRKFTFPNKRHWWRGRYYLIKVTSSLGYKLIFLFLISLSLSLSHFLFLFLFIRYGECFFSGQMAFFSR